MSFLQPLRAGLRPTRKPGDPLRGLYRAAAFNNSAQYDALIEGVFLGGLRGLLLVAANCCCCRQQLLRSITCTFPDAAGQRQKSQLGV
jgi:hypothetical protein